MSITRPQSAAPGVAASNTHFTLVVLAAPVTWAGAADSPASGVAADATPSGDSGDSIAPIVVTAQRLNEARLGIEPIAASLDRAFDRLARVVLDPEAARSQLLG